MFSFYIIRTTLYCSVLSQMARSCATKIILLFIEYKRIYFTKCKLLYMKTYFKNTTKYWQNRCHRSITMSIIKLKIYIKGNTSSTKIILVAKFNAIPCCTINDCASAILYQGIESLQEIWKVNWFIMKTLTIENKWPYWV